MSLRHAILKLCLSHFLRPGINLLAGLMAFVAVSPYKDFGLKYFVLTEFIIRSSRQSVLDDKSEFIQGPFQGMLYHLVRRSPNSPICGEMRKVSP